MELESRVKPSSGNLLDETTSTDPTVPRPLDCVISNVCLFCFKILAHETPQNVFTTLTPFGIDLEIRLDNPEKNVSAFQLICKLMNVSVTKRDGLRFEREGALPLCLKCQHLYEEIYQLHVQITELDKLMRGRVEVIREMVRRSSMKVEQGDEGGGLTQLTLNGLDVWRRKVLNGGVTVLNWNENEGEETMVENRRARNSRAKNKVNVKEENEVEYDVSEDNSFQWEQEEEEESGLDFDSFEDPDYDPLYEPMEGGGGGSAQTSKEETPEGKHGVSNDEFVTGDVVGDDSKSKIRRSPSSRTPGKRKRGPKPKCDRPPDYIPWKARPFEIAKSGKPKHRYTCHLCNEVMIGYGPFKQHYDDQHPEENRYTCKFCKQHFPGLWECHAHQRKHTGERPYDCPNCSKKFPTVKSRNSHIRNVHTENAKPHVCEKCGKRCVSESALRYHEEIHSNTVVYCKVCGVGYKNSASFKKHNKIKHEGKADCTKPLANADKDQLESLGVEVEDVKSRQVCHLCWKTISGRVNFQNHFDMIHNGADPRQCKCGKKFATYVDCRRHAARHLGKKHIQCGQCPKKFYTNNELQSHSKVHTPNRTNSHVCDICGTGFSYKGNLTEHRKKHEGTRWICEICGKSYAERKGYMLHKKSIHLNIRPHKCSHCPRSFTEPGDLRKHIRSHTKEKPFKCTLCEKSFPYSSSRTRHIEEVHNKRKVNRTPKSKKIEVEDKHVHAVNKEGAAEEFEGSREEKDSNSKPVPNDLHKQDNMTT